MTVQSIYQGRDIKPENGRIRRAGKSGGMSFDQHMQANVTRCKCCKSPSAKLYQYDMCWPCLKVRQETFLRPFIDKQRAEIFNDRIQLGV